MPISSENPTIDPSSTPTTLSSQLQDVSTKSRTMMPESAIQSMDSSNKSLAENYKPSPLSIGSQAPQFSLNDTNGTTFTLQNLLQQHSAVIITWYRGSWCPFCNLTLRALTQVSPKFDALGAKLIALTPETATESKDLIDKYQIPFPVLVDDGLNVADSFGVTFQVREDMKTFFTQMGLDLDFMNGNSGKRTPRLPLPATFVVSKDGSIVYSFADVDYTKRAEPEHVLQVVQKLVQ